MSQFPKSLFASDEVQSREIELPDGSKHTFRFRQLPATEFRKYSQAEESPDPDVHAGSMARLIAASVCGEDGKLILPLKEALKLNAQATNALFLAVLSVNSMAKKEGEQTPGEG